MKFKIAALIIAMGLMLLADIGRTQSIGATADRELIYAHPIPAQEKCNKLRFELEKEDRQNQKKIQYEMLTLEHNAQRESTWSFRISYAKAMQQVEFTIFLILATALLMAAACP